MLACLLSRGERSGLTEGWLRLLGAGPRFRAYRRMKPCLALGLDQKRIGLALFADCG